ncbi:caspase-7-like [Glandiceps talaboti]
MAGVNLETDTMYCQQLVKNEADFLVGYSTVPGYKSFRNKSTGSVYIQKLVDALKTHADDNDILLILTKVNDEVGKLLVHREGDICVTQCPAMVSTLRKRLFFIKS